MEITKHWQLKSGVSVDALQNLDMLHNKLDVDSNNLMFNKKQTTNLSYNSFTEALASKRFEKKSNKSFQIGIQLLAIMNTFR